MSYKSNQELEREYDEHIQHSRYFQADKVSNTLKSRGFFYHEDEDEHHVRSGGYTSIPSTSGLPVFLHGILGIGFAVFLIMVAYQILNHLPMGIYTEGILPFYHDILLGLRPSFPLGESYSTEVIKAKLLLPFCLLSVGGLVFLMFGLLSICTLNFIRMRYMTVPLATFVLLASFYMMYLEYPLGDAGVFSIFTFVVTFFVCVFPLKRLKKNWKVGLYIMIMSSLGFLLMGNNLLAPYVCLTSGGAILLFTPGYFWGIGRNG
ncbi:hypothetical protein [Priestia aryabhattai]|uniref:hypothetical protein n=1 Tax=Priestia aryabhattai TaxID=412384 RepID=UPI001C8D36F1|nr:hypothetical protein [Priestia aryabhattai]MBX9988117.1 hypothetical protein [Priestia aryabhattai]MBY0001510.1 hypothetical protein [Priestia aryabhattai]